MNFIIDAQLPRRLSHRLNELGYNSKHTLDLPLKNHTPDKEIERISTEEKRIVVTKDTDFVDTFTLYHRPYKLLLIATGNISNNELEFLLIKNITRLSQLFNKYDFIELNKTTLTIHE